MFFSLDSDLAIFDYRFLPILANLFVKFGYKGFLNLTTLNWSTTKKWSAFVEYTWKHLDCYF